jgi:4-carboxymuconolactone decarboxylase
VIPRRASSPTIWWKNVEQDQRCTPTAGRSKAGEIVPRIDLITETSEIGEEQYAEYDHIVEVLHGVRGPFSIMMHSPGLAEKVMSAGAQVRLGSTLSPVEREIAVISTSREKDAAYEWNSHVTTGRNAGMREEVIDAVRSKADVSGLEPDERDIVTFVRQLIRTNRVEQSLFDELVARHSARWVVELAATVGQYQYIAAINNTFELLPGADADPLPIV